MERPGTRNDKTMDQATFTPTAQKIVDSEHVEKSTKETLYEFVSPITDGVAPTPQKTTAKQDPKGRSPVIEYLNQVPKEAIPPSSKPFVLVPFYAHQDLTKCQTVPQSKDSTTAYGVNPEILTKSQFNDPDKICKSSKKSILNMKKEKTSADIRKSGYKIACGVCLGLVLTVVILGVVIGIMVTNKGDDNAEDQVNYGPPPPKIPNVSHDIDPKLMVTEWLPKFQWDLLVKLTIEPLRHFIEIRKTYMKNQEKYSKVKKALEIALNSIKFLLIKSRDLGVKFGHRYAGDYRTNFQEYFHIAIACLKRKAVTNATDCTNELISQMALYVNQSDVALLGVKMCAENLESLYEAAMDYQDLRTSASKLLEKKTGFTKFLEALESVTKQLQYNVKDQFVSTQLNPTDYESLAYIEMAEDHLAYLCESYPYDAVLRLFDTEGSKLDALKANAGAIYKKIMGNFSADKEKTHKIVLKRIIDL